MTSDISLKEYKHLIPFIIVTRSLSQPHPTLQILRHTCLATGTISRLKNQDIWPDTASGNVYLLYCRAVGLNAPHSPKVPKINYLQYENKLYV